MCPEPKKNRVYSFKPSRAVIFLIGTSKKNSIKVVILLAMMVLYKFF